MAFFRLLGEVHSAETIAESRGIRELARLVELYGEGHWRKRRGYGRVELQGGETRHAELHWYEAHGIGRHEMKIKRFVD